MGDGHQSVFYAHDEHIVMDGMECAMVTILRYCPFKHAIKERENTLENMILQFMGNTNRFFTSQYYQNMYLRIHKFYCTVQDNFLFKTTQIKMQIKMYFFGLYKPIYKQAIFILFLGNRVEPATSAFL